MQSGKSRNQISIHTTCRGFTLVELLVVIGIIAVLIGILIPVLSKARAASQRVVCLSNIRQLYTGILMYCNDNNGWFPTMADAADGISTIEMDDDWIFWQQDRNLDNSSIAKYLGASGEKLQQLYRCPADTFDGRKPIPGVLKGQGTYLYSYAMNNAVASNVKPPLLFRTKITTWLSPAKKILLTEPMGGIAGPGYYSAPCWSYSEPLTPRHGAAVSHVRGRTMGVNVSTAFMDGHAEGIDEDFANNAFQMDGWAQ